MDSQPNKIIFITGASKGIGKALSLELLNKGCKVVGLSRSSPKIDHPNFEFRQIDLSEPESVDNFAFPAVEESNVVLVNNAGVIGDILPIGELSSKQTRKVMQVNVAAVITLTNSFYQKYGSKVSSGHVLTLGSGAGIRPIDAWSNYCASKAAAHLFMECFAAELELRGMTNWFVHTISPGVVDTQMQVEIRSADSKKFLIKDRFVAMKNDGDLASPEVVGEKISRIIDSPKSYASILIQLRDL